MTELLAIPSFPDRTAATPVRQEESASILAARDRMGRGARNELIASAHDQILACAETLRRLRKELDALSAASLEIS
jgi:hypothetical protein